MTQLKKIQQAFQASLQNNDNSIAEYIAKPPNMNVEDRLKIYYNDYFYRLRDALKDDYEKTCHFIGESAFDSLVESYLKTYPSATYTLRDIGFQFPRFLEESKQSLGTIELAQFECEIIYALYAVDTPGLTIEDLASIDPERWVDLQLHLHSSVRKIVGNYNTLDLWMSLDNEGNIQSEKLTLPLTYLIWRNNHRAYFRALDTNEAALLEGIVLELPFSELCEKMLERFDDETVVQWVSEVLQAWITDGIFSNYQRAGSVLSFDCNH